MMSNSRKPTGMKGKACNNSTYSITGIRVIIVVVMVGNALVCLRGLVVGGCFYSGPRKPVFYRVFW